VGLSLLIFLVVYAVVFVAGAIYILRLLGRGPEAAEPPPGSEVPRAPGTALAAARRELEQSS
jgi:cytochrome d ubiquinol oxidase subunit I